MFEKSEVSVERIIVCIVSENLAEHDIHCVYGVCHAPLKLICEMLPEIHTMEKFDFIKSIIHSPII